MAEIEYSEDGKVPVRCPEDYKGELVIPVGVTEIGMHVKAVRACALL